MSDHRMDADEISDDVHTPKPMSGAPVPTPPARHLLEESQRNVPLPPWHLVQQSFPDRALPSVAAAVRAQLARPEIAATLRPGDRVAVCVGSRGIGCLAEVVRSLVAGLRGTGTEPFLVPAMGSHGGGTAEGQLEILASLGVTEASVGAPIRASMEVVELGEVLDGIRVHADKIAATEADAVIPVARIKPHTDFRGPMESGLHKMLGIGLGKHRGAAYLHGFPLASFGELVPAVGALVRSRLPVPFGIAIVEDGNEQPGVIEAVLGEAMSRREPELLALAKEWLPRLPFEAADVLIVQEIGKNISGAGMDPNVTGRYPLGNVPPEIDVRSLIVLDLSEATHGNASGIGMADLTTRRAVGKIDRQVTYTNHVTSRTIAAAKIPLTAYTDREALDIAVHSLFCPDPARLRVAWIRNTLELTTLRLSEPLWKELDGTPGLTALTGSEPVRFDSDGSLLAGPEEA